MTYDKNIVFAVGTARVAANDPILSLYENFFIGFMVDQDTHRIVDLTANTVSPKTCDFIHSMLVGYHLIDDLDDMVEEVRSRYLGIAQKAIISALKDARNKYSMALKN